MATGYPISSANSQLSLLLDCKITCSSYACNAKANCLDYKYRNHATQFVIEAQILANLPWPNCLNN